MRSFCTITSRMVSGFVQGAHRPQRQCEVDHARDVGVDDGAPIRQGCGQPVCIAWQALEGIDNAIRCIAALLQSADCADVCGVLVVVQSMQRQLEGLLRVGKARYVGDLVAMCLQQHLRSSTSPNLLRCRNLQVRKRWQATNRWHVDQEADLKLALRQLPALIN